MSRDSKRRLGQQQARAQQVAADQGDVSAQVFLGVMYELGHGVSQDDAEAARWYRLAADQGDANGQFQLGRMYVTGEGVPQDYVQAHMRFNLAAAQTSRKEYVKARDSVAEKITADQIAEAQRLAREWKPTRER